MKYIKLTYTAHEISIIDAALAEASFFWWAKSENHWTMRLASHYAQQLMYRVRRAAVVHQDSYTFALDAASCLVLEQALLAVKTDESDQLGAIRRIVATLNQTLA